MFGNETDICLDERASGRVEAPGSAITSLNSLQLSRRPVGFSNSKPFPVRRIEREGTPPFAVGFARPTVLRPASLLSSDLGALPRGKPVDTAGKRLSMTRLFH